MHRTASSVEERIEAVWTDLLAFGPRVHGTAGAERAVGFIERELAAAGIAARRHAFAAPSWSSVGVAQLIVHEPEHRVMDCEPMLLSAGTPGGGEVTGRLVDLGVLSLWGGQHAWRRLALVGAAGRPVAYICGRSNGAAIPQLLPPGSADLPHLCIGTKDVRHLDGWLSGGVPVHMSLRSNVARGSDVEAHNVCGIVPGHAGGDRRVALVAHYDTVPTTVGAFDNASGVIAVLEVARRLARVPIEPSVDILLFGGEELGLLGSQAYVGERHAAGELGAIDFVINIEGLGRGDTLDVWVGPASFEWAVATEARELAHRRDARVRTTFPPLPGSDHAPFYAAGVPVAMLTFDDQEVLHSEHDVANAESLRNICFGAELAEHLLRTLPERGSFS